MFAVSSIDNGDEIISAIANPIQIFAGTDIYRWIMIALGCILVIIL